MCTSTVKYKSYVYVVCSFSYVLHWILEFLNCSTYEFILCPDFKYEVFKVNFWELQHSGMTPSKFNISKLFIRSWIFHKCKHFLYLLTYSMGQSPSWEANWFSASQEIPPILWNLKVHYHIHKCPPPVPILSHIDPVHALTSHCLKIHLNIILPSTPEYWISCFYKKWWAFKGFNLYSTACSLGSSYREQYVSHCCCRFLLTHLATSSKYNTNISAKTDNKELSSQSLCLKWFLILKTLAQFTTHSHLHPKPQPPPHTHTHTHRDEETTFLHFCMLC